MITIVFFKWSVTEHSHAVDMRLFSSFKKIQIANI